MINAVDNVKPDLKPLEFFFSKISEGLAFCKIITNAEGKPVDWVYLDINDAYERINGVKKADIVSRRATEVLPNIQRDPGDWINLYGRVALTGESIITERYSDVRKKWYHVSAYCPQKGYFISIFEDITERKITEKEIERLASFPELNPNPVVEVDVDGEITYANPATNRLFPDLKKAGLKHVFFFGWRKIKTAFEEKNTDTFGRELRINGRWYHQQFCLVPQTQQIRIYSIDVDELKQTEQARAKAQTKLEANAVMLEEYASQMEELAEQRAQQLQNAERLAAIGQTAGMVGHDIRNPLQAITSDMYIISEEAKALADCESKQAIMESIESVNQNLNYINKIVSDLQDYTRPLKPNFQDVSLAEIVEGALLTVSIPRCVEVTTDIKDDALFIRTDVAYMRRILTNLTTNAVQAMQEKGKLSIHAKNRDGDVLLTVTDTGVGIPDEAKAKMFTPLFTTKSKGQGLGLAVVRRLVESLGGSITFESEEGKGTKFTVELPQRKQVSQR